MATATAVTSTSTTGSKQADLLPADITVKEFNPADQFAKAFKLLDTPEEIVLQDPDIEVVYDKTRSPTDRILLCRKSHPSGLYEYHIRGVLPVSET